MRIANAAGAVSKVPAVSRNSLALGERVARLFGDSGGDKSGGNRGASLARIPEPSNRAGVKLVESRCADGASAVPAAIPTA